jgi:hypothetical protein
MKWLVKRASLPGRSHSAHLLRYGSSMMGFTHVSRRQALHLNQMETADRHISVVSLLK